MSSVYTNIARKRIDQSAQATAAPQVQSPEQPATVPPPHQSTEVEGKQEKEDKSRHLDVTTSERHDVDHRAWRDVIEDTDARNSSLRITNNEKYAVKDLVDELERKYKIKTSLNELARLGLLYILDDFKKNKLNSLIIKVKKS
jgi:hypothetical protein